MSLLVLLLVLAGSAFAAPGINLPINAQVPPVAVANQAYNFVFSASTFTSAAGPISYVLGDCPSWMQLDNSTRTFYGTPDGVGTGQVGSFVVDLIATDVTGSSTMPVTFVITTDPGPGLGTPVAAQLPAFGAFSSPDALLLAPGNALSMKFSPNTFTNTNENTIYYAFCANNTPLPSWVNFDPASLSFSGIAPQATSPSELPQTFGIHLTATEVPGFAQAVASFELVLESHMFTFGNSLQIINTTFGSPINFTGLQHDLTLDGQPFQPSDLDHIAGDGPSWLSLDKGTLALYGTPPLNTAQQNFTVTAIDKYGDSASTVVLIQIAGQSSVALIGPIPTLNATIGMNFTYALKDSLPPSGDVNVTVDPGTASAWLDFDPHSWELYGYVPSNLKPQTVRFNITAIQHGQSQSQIVEIDVKCGSAPCPTTTTSSHAGTPEATAGAGATSASGTSRNKSWIAAAVVLPLAAFAGLLILLCCCCRKWRQRWQSKSKKTERLLISRPIDEEKDHKFGIISTAPQNPENDQNRRVSKTSEAPKISWFPGIDRKRISRFRLSKSTTDNVNRSPRPDSWQSYVRDFESSRPKRPAAAQELSLTSGEQTPNAADIITYSSETSPSANLLRPASGNLSPARWPSKKDKTISTMSSGNTGLSIGRSRSGFGHGRIGPSPQDSSLFFVNRGIGHGGGGTSNGPPGWGIVRKSWRNLSRLSWTSTQSPPNSTDPIVEEGFQRPPTQKSFASIISSFPCPSTSTSVNKAKRPQVIHEASDSETSRAASEGMHRPPEARLESPSRRKGSVNGTRLQDFHKRRLQQNTSRNPLFSAHLSSSRKSSLRIGRQSAEPQNNGEDVLGTVTIANPTFPRSYSQSSSLEPHPSSDSSPARSSKSISSHRGKKSHINYHFTTRTLSPLPRSRSSYASTSGSSKLSDPVNIHPFYASGALLEDTDEEGNKRWRHPAHPNPLGTNMTHPTNNTDVTDLELIDSLQAAGHFSAAQRLDYLRSQMTRSGANESEADATVEVRSARGRKLDHKTGLKSADSGTKSMRGDIGDAGGSAFM